MTLRLTRLGISDRIVNPDGTPTQQFVRLYNKAMENIETAVNGLETALTNIIDLNDLITEVETATTAAQAAADAANAAADASADATALQNSWVSGLTLTATDAGANVTITISAHTRNYADGTSVSVSGGSLTGRAYSTTYFIYYDQASRAGGAVSYQSTTTESTAAQVGDRHAVGRVLTPAALGGPESGVGPRPPGIEPEP